MYTDRLLAQRDATDPVRTPLLNWHFAAVDHTYLVDAWQPGVLHPTTRQEALTGPLRFDLRRQQVEMLNEATGQVLIYDPAMMSSFQLESADGHARNFVRTPNPSPLSRHLVFMEQLIDGPCPVLLHRQLLTKSSLPPRSRAFQAQGRTVVSPSLYTLNEQRHLVPLPHNRRAARHFFGDQYDDVMTYARTHGLKLRRLNHLLALMHHYNDLLSPTPASQGVLMEAREPVPHFAATQN